MQLLSLGAPAELVDATHRAALDEVRHAKLCYGLAHAYGEPAQGPGRLVEASAPLEVGLAAFTQAVVLEGCVGETLSALEAAWVAGRAADPRLRAALATVAQDELAHAVLAFDTVRWLVATFGAGARRAVAAAIAQAQAGSVAAAAGEEHAGCELAEHGLIDDATRAALRSRAFRQTVVEPLAAMLEAPAQTGDLRGHARPAGGCPCRAEMRACGGRYREGARPTPGSDSETWPTSPS